MIRPEVVDGITELPPPVRPFGRSARHVLGQCLAPKILDVDEHDLSIRLREPLQSSFQQITVGF